MQAGKQFFPCSLSILLRGERQQVRGGSTGGASHFLVGKWRRERRREGGRRGWKEPPSEERHREGRKALFFPKPFLTLTLPSPEREEDEFVVPHTPHPVRSALVAVVVVVFVVIVVCSGKE